MTSRPLHAGDPDAVRVLVASQPFCDGLDAAHVVAMADGASERTLDAGDFVIRHGHEADALYLILDGDVAVEVADPAYDPLTIETLHAGDPIGWSWLYPPRTWSFDARCLTAVRLLSLDGGHLRHLVEGDPAFGRELVFRVGRMVAERLQFARAQLVDVHHHDHR